MFARSIPARLISRRVATAANTVAPARGVRVPPTHSQTPSAHAPGPRIAPKPWLFSRASPSAAAAAASQPRAWSRWTRRLGQAALWTSLATGGLTLAVATQIPVEADASPRTRVETVIKGTWRSVSTFAVTASIMVDYKMLYMQHGHMGIESEEYVALRTLVHQKSAEKLLWLCKNHGGIYNKAAQHVGSLVKMVPKEYTDTLSVLQDRAPYHPFDEVCRVFQRELGGLPMDFFLEFDQEPMAAASLAQVHRAMTHDGRECAVKVQYEEVVRNFRVDLVVMDTLTQLVTVFFPEFHLGWIVREFETNLTQEFDFRLEGRNAQSAAERFAHRNSRGDFHIPDIHWDLTSERILTMEFIHGTRVTNVAELTRKGFDLDSLQTTLIDVFSEMIFVQGFVHCDPHPGNMLVRASPTKPGVTQLVLLDHGLYRELDEPFRKTYCDLWVGILTTNDQLLMSVGERLGPGGSKYWAYFPLMFAGVVRKGPGAADPVGAIPVAADSTVPLQPPPLLNATTQMHGPNPGAAAAEAAADEPMVIGDEFDDSHRRKVRKSMRGVQFSLEDALDFIEGLPRDMLLVMRTINLVSGVHRALGGKNLPKFRAHAWFAVLGRHTPMGRDTSVLGWIGRWVTVMVVGTASQGGSLRALRSWAREWAVVWFRVWVVLDVLNIARDVRRWWSSSPLASLPSQSPDVGPSSQAVA
ncbi:ABC1 family-domain-containing protein [Blastocladiella britannica]|nr:ABC1 family-domain-containing protein [Blastocladiella britannica]